MRVHLEPVGLYSRAMVRIARALERELPEAHEVVQRRDHADLCVLYAIGWGYAELTAQLRDEGKRVALVQCCLDTAGQAFLPSWLEPWKLAEVVWSYYDLNDLFLRRGFVAPSEAGVNVYHAPLGLDGAFCATGPRSRRDLTALTTGYVSGGCAEAIEEVWTALRLIGGSGFHVGPPKVQGIAGEQPAPSAEGIPDEALAALYGRAEWVAALRHVEGFEMPAAEGLACGARPILFDQPTTRRWYEDLAVFVPDCSGEELVNRLAVLLRNGAEPVSEEERMETLVRFDWARIGRDFWARAIQ